jgi:hypothetical protein
MIDRHKLGALSDCVEDEAQQRDRLPAAPIECDEFCSRDRTSEGRRQQGDAGQAVPEGRKRDGLERLLIETPADQDPGRAPQEGDDQRQRSGPTMTQEILLDRHAFFVPTYPLEAFVR